MRQQSILYSCLYKEKIQREQPVDFNSLVYIQSGSIHFSTADGVRVYRAGDIVLIRRNQLTRAEKIPDINGEPVKSITLFLTQENLRQYAVENAIGQQPVYSGQKMLRLSPNVFLEAFFHSLVPYFDHPEALSEPLMQLKTKEAIELLLRLDNGVRKFLFDFSEPYKMDLEAFMLRNFEYNVPMKEFARLSGRSISTFKRDFQKTFETTPEKWLRAQRLEKAYYLIKEKHQKPGEIYLRVGFENLSHFSTAFKEHFGFTPSSV